MNQPGTVGETAETPRRSDQAIRLFGIGVLGWLIPLITALPLAFGHESAGGEAVLFAGIVGCGLAIVGCVVAGAVVGARAGPRRSTGDAFAIGFAGVAVSGVAALLLSVVIESVVDVLDLGPVPLLVPIPLVVGYCLGFGVGRIR